MSSSKRRFFVSELNKVDTGSADVPVRDATQSRRIVRFAHCGPGRPRSQYLLSGLVDVAISECTERRDSRNENRLRDLARIDIINSDARGPNQDHGRSQRK